MVALLSSFVVVATLLPIPRRYASKGVERYGSTACPTLISRNAPLISRDAGRVTVRVIRTDEELMIARSVVRSCVDGFP